MAAKAEIASKDSAQDLLERIERALGLADQLDLPVVAIHLQTALDMLRQQPSE